MIGLQWTFESEDYLVKQICRSPDYWCSNEGEFWYVNRSLGVEIELEIKGKYIIQFHEKTRKRWNVKNLMDELFGVGNHSYSTKNEYDKAGRDVEKITSGPKPTKPKRPYKKRHKKAPVPDV